MESKVGFFKTNYIKLSFYILIFSSILFYSINSLTIGDFPYVKKLNNGRYIVISSRGIAFLDKNLINESHNITFDTEIIYNEISFLSTCIEQFPKEDDENDEYDEYIIVFFRTNIYKYIYIFSSNETLISKTENISLNDDFNFYQYYSIIPYGHSVNEYYFSLIYQENHFLKIIKGIYDSTSNSTSLILFNSLEAYQMYYYQAFSCILMSYYDNQKIINCIYANHERFTYINFYLDESFHKINENFLDYFIIYDQTYIKSLVLPGKKESILCSFNPHSSNNSCFKYNILNDIINPLYSPPILYPIYSQNSILFEYFEETDEILLGFIMDTSPIIYFSQCTKDLICTDFIMQSFYESFGHFSLYYKPNIVIPLNLNNYYALLPFIYIETTGILLKLNIANDYFSSFNSNSLDAYLLCDYYNSYDHKECLTTIPDGFYCNDSVLKTIDKCHENCKTCNQGPTIDNNNCLICNVSITKYFDLGNCTSNCSFGYYSINSNYICKCSKENKCGYCTEESLQNNLCITCNKEGNYYQKSDEEIRNDSFINCYKNPEGYYLKNEMFYPCYSNCKNCVEEGNDFDNKCVECKIGFEFRNDIEYNSNCYRICEYFYFYDSNNIYYCTQDNNCPENYKLISYKRKCIDNCIHDNIYKYEYNNACFENCPIGTKISNDNNFKCEQIINCNNINKYYNYNLTECLDSIPEGYYCNDTELKTIDKCHNNCEICEEGPTDINNNCLKCRDSLYLDLGNCVDSCIHGPLINDGLNICKCSSDIKCEICSEFSTIINLCISCNIEEGYYPKSNDINNIFQFINCYNNETISDGYYLNISLNSYEPCYNTCSKCSYYGDNINNNCDECKIGYYFNSNTSKNCYQCNNYYYFDSSNNYHCTEGNYCPESYTKLIRSKRRCIDNCNNDNTYIYEYQNECYSNCPSKTGPNENNICIPIQTDLELKCPEEYPYEMINEKKCVQQCNITYLLNNICKINNPKAKESGINNIKESIKDGSIDDILKNIKENGEDLIINEKDIKYQITTTDNQNNNQNNNISSIKLGACENILKEKYNISEDESLLIFKIDVKVEGLSSSVVEYEVYHPTTKIPLELSYCQNTSIQIQVPVSINEDEIYKYDPSSDYYNDICSPSTSDNGTDIILSDRQNEFVNSNLSLCQDGCTFSGYDSTTKKANCECEVKTKISDLTSIKIDKDKFFDGFIDLKSLININIMKCYKLLFSKDGFTNNMGNYIVLPIIAYNVISSILFYLKGYNLLKNQIYKMVEQLKEYENINDNLTDKNIKIFDGNPKIGKKKHRKKKMKNMKKKKKKKKPKGTDDNLQKKI